MMNRREFSLGASALGLGLAGPALAQAPQYKEGKNYLKLNKPAPTRSPAGKVEVVEFFGYFCPHCNTFDPTLNAWLKSPAAPAQMAFRRVPVNFDPRMIPGQKLYYALEGLGQIDALHSAAFRSVHVERKPLESDAQVFDWATRNGLDLSKFKEAYNSFSVANQVRQATQLQEAYRVEGVPSMGVAGRYYIDGGTAGGMPQMLQVVSHLVGQAAKG